MKVCVDENIPFITVSELRNLGHEVLDVRGTNEQGIPDEGSTFSLTLLVAR